MHRKKEGITKQFINQSPQLDSDVEEEIKRANRIILNMLSLDYVPSHNNGVEYGALTEILGTIKQHISNQQEEIESLDKTNKLLEQDINDLNDDKILLQSKLDKIEELNNINETIILMLSFPHNSTFKKEFERLGSGKRKQQILMEVKRNG